MTHPPTRRRRPRPAVIGLALLLASGLAAAQYKIIGPDGRVTYTDKPPTATTRPSGPNVGAAADGAAGAAMPPEVQKARGRYPVNLFSTRDCGPCDQARGWLKARGIPYSEYSVTSEADVKALISRFGDRNLPVVTFGRQVVRGYSAGELQSWADAAGYPAQSRLAGYAWPTAVPLAPPSAVDAAQADGAEAEASPAPAPPPPAPAPPPKPTIQF